MRMVRERQEKKKGERKNREMGKKLVIKKRKMMD
jgi:hypothetical protein